jgi:hypothetical protein
MEKEIGKICSLIGKGGRLSVAEKAFIRVNLSFKRVYIAILPDPGKRGGLTII